MTEVDLLLRGSAALVAGALIGLERTYRGRAAGLRTYALVALGASLLVAMAELAHGWAAAGAGDPTRVVQGIVTGIGFLGAGVIIREGFSVRGLTTAASIWVVAVIGVTFGGGLYATGVAATVATWVALELLRQLENRIPVHSLVHCDIEFARNAAWDQSTVQHFLHAHGFNVAEFSYSLDRAAQTVTYELVMWSSKAKAPASLERGLLEHPQVLGFRVRPGRD